MHNGYKVLIVIDGNSVLILCDPKRILGQQLSPYQVHRAKIIMIIIIIMKLFITVMYY
jgi:hypothetical protein